MTRRAGNQLPKDTRVRCRFGGGGADRISVHMWRHMGLEFIVAEPNSCPARNVQEAERSGKRGLQDLDWRVKRPCAGECEEQDEVL